MRTKTPIAARFARIAARLFARELSAHPRSASAHWANAAAAGGLGAGAAIWLDLGGVYGETLLTNVEVAAVVGLTAAGFEFFRHHLPSMTGYRLGRALVEAALLVTTAAASVGIAAWMG